MANKRYLRVTLVWKGDVAEERVYSRPTRIIVGESKKAAFVVPGLPAEFDLFRPGPGGWVLRLLGGMEGTLNLKGEATDAGKLLRDARVGKTEVHEVPVGDEDSGTVVVGDLAVRWRFERPSEVTPKVFFFRRADPVLIGTVLFAAVVQVSLLLVSRLVFDEEPEVRRIKVPDRIVKMLIEKPEQIEEIKPEGPSEGKKAPGEEGKFGKKDSKIVQSKVPKQDGALVDKIKDLGIHKALSSQLLQQGPFKDIFGDVQVFDSKLRVAMDGHGDALVVGQGSGGMGMRGTGTGGGGGPGFGRVWGMGNIDSGGGKGVKASLGGKGKATVKASVSRGQAQTAGFCSSADIQRVVETRSAGIKFCYEKELQRAPELAGKVVVNWIIGLEGTVTKAYIVSSTLNSKAVEDCMLAQIRRWRFQKPEGGQCSVNFPFVFKGGL